MAYTIKLTNGTVLTTISNLTVDNTTSLTLLGKNYAGYGGYVAENFTYLLENFAFGTPPLHPLAGQLWWNTTIQVMEVWNGTAWVSIVPITVIPPIIPEVANEAGLPAAGSAPSPVYYVDSYTALNGLPALASRLGSNWYYYPSKMSTYATDTGTANNITVSLTPAPSSLTSMIGVPFVVKMANQNTGNVSLILNGFASKSVLDPDGRAIGPLKLTANGLYEFIYDGTNFQLVSATSPASVRFRLTGVLNLYVDVAIGNDNNSGLTPTTAFKSLQRAWDYLLNNIDMNGQTVNVNVANGTYTAASGTTVLVVSGTVTGGKTGSIAFIGKVSTPTTCIISGVQASCVYVISNDQCSFAGFSFTATGPANGAGCGVISQRGSFVYLANCVFGACQQGHQYAVGGSIYNFGPTFINGGGLVHVACDVGGLWYGGGTITILNAVTFTFFTTSVNQSLVDFAGAATTFVNAGSVSGQKFYVANASGIITYTQTGDINYFPGSSAGVIGALAYYA